MTATGAFAENLAAARETVLQLFAAAVAAVDPTHAVKSALALHNGMLQVDETAIAIPAGVHVIAVGKAAVAMTRGALDVLGDAIVSGELITKDGHVDAPLPSRVQVSEAGHPVPDQRGVAATTQALEALAKLDDRVVVLALISGGGSALLEAPVAGLTLDDLARTTDVLLRAGAPIHALNTVRSPLSRVKGGGLRVASPRARWVTLVLSDVLGNDTSVIASGPTVAGGRDPARALEIIASYGVRGALPASVIARLDGGSLEERPRARDDDVVVIVGDNATAVAAAEARALALGARSRIAWSAVEGEAATLGREFVAVAAQEPLPTDVILGGGEATVTVRGDGRGGRNTEFALAAALELERRDAREWVIASLATDGQDALTGLAGAIADCGTASRARERGLDPEQALADNDSATVFDIAGGAVETGPTGTNVNDIYVALRVGKVPSGNERGF
jgi:hydroxypyruvate reductase